MLSLKTHNIMDYVIGAVLVLSPFLFGFTDIDAARNVFILLGFGLILLTGSESTPRARLCPRPFDVHLW